MSDMNDLTARASQLIGAYAEVLMSTTAAAVEQLQLANQVAQLEHRMAAYGQVLELIDAQRRPLLERREQAPPALRAALDRQLALLAAQEAAVLERLGVEPEAARLAVQASLPAPRALRAPAPRGKTRVREYTRTLPSANGAHEADGAPAEPAA